MMESVILKLSIGAAVLAALIFYVGRSAREKQKRKQAEADADVLEEQRDIAAGPDRPVHDVVNELFDDE